MNHHPFLGGVGLGMLAGAALSMAIAPKKKDLKRTARKAMRTMGDLAEDLRHHGLLSTPGTGGTALFLGGPASGCRKT